MTRPPSETLISQLAAEARAVRRLRPPLSRALLWIVGFLTVAAIAIWVYGSAPGSLARFGDIAVQLEMAGALLTGVAALIAAFFVSLPDRSRLWMALPLPFLAFWLLGSGYGCYLHLIEFGPSGWALGDSWNCLGFILGVSAPASIALYFSLRESTPLDPVAPLAMGGLGVSGLAAAVLQFFHPFAVTFLDLGMHVVAVAIVVLLLVVVGRRGFADQNRA